MRARKEGTDLRQEQIVQAALDLIGESGLDSLNISGIALRVGLVPSAFYRHFKSKEDVLDAVVDALRDRLLENVQKTREETPKAIPRLRSLLIRHARMLSENRALPNVIFSDGIYSGNPSRKARVRGIITTYLHLIQEMIEQGVQDGTIRKDIPVRTMATMFLGIILPAAVLSNISEGGMDIVDHVEKAWPVFEECISTGRCSSSP